MTYDEVKILETNPQKKLLEIRNIETELFDAIKKEQSSFSDEERNYLNGKINALQSAYSLICL